jgi:hypothetical protein
MIALLSRAKFSTAAVPGVVEQRRVRALQLGAEALHDFVELGLVEIKLGSAADEREAEIVQRLGHQPGVVSRIVEGARQRG